jgi:UDP-N-acetylmuramate--alanine ligase
MTARTHFIGISGTGLSAIARVLLEREEKVSGSDQVMTEQSRRLESDGAVISIGHEAKNVNGASRVIRSSAIPDNNVEVIQAQESGIPVLKRSEALGEILANKKLIAVAGSHGKTTTSAMLAWTLTSLDLDPGYIVGSDLVNTGKNASAGKSDYFVIEADEYDNMFLGLEPSLAIITNVEHDHPDVFPTREEFFDAFRNFVDRIPDGGQLLYCADDVGASEIAGYARMRGISVFSYSIDGNEADFKGENLASVGAGFEFSFSTKNEKIDQVVLNVPGKHNVQNATGSLAAFDLLEISLSKSADALSEFKGTDRRFQVAGNVNGIVYVDDYAHHPSEIKATLQAATDNFPNKRIVAAWQPHTYSRTVLLWGDFVQSLGSADELIILPVFEARETRPQEFDLRQLAKKSKLVDSIVYQDMNSAVQYLDNELKSNDLLIVLSAGDAVEINRKLLKVGGAK